MLSAISQPDTRRFGLALLARGMCAHGGSNRNTDPPWMHYSKMVRSYSRFPFVERAGSRHGSLANRVCHLARGIPCAMADMCTRGRASLGWCAWCGCSAPSMDPTPLSCAASPSAPHDRFLWVSCAGDCAMALGARSLVGPTRPATVLVALLAQDPAPTFLRGGGAPQCRAPSVLRAAALGVQFSLPCLGLHWAVIALLVAPLFHDASGARRRALLWERFGSGCG